MKKMSHKIIIIVGILLVLISASIFAYIEFRVPYYKNAINSSIKDKNYENTITYSDKLIALNKEKTFALKNKAYALGKLDRGEESLASYKELISLDSTDPEILNQIGILYNDTIKDYNEAIKYFDMAIALKDELAELVDGQKPVDLFEPLDTGVWIRFDVDTVCSVEQQYVP